MECRICDHQTDYVFSQEILGKYQCKYFFCGVCGFLHTEEPYWRDEAYTNAIADADTGLVWRNVDIVPRLAVVLYLLFGKEGTFVDLAGGTGLLVRMMRDIGFDFLWSDLFCVNVHARGFEFEAGSTNCSAATAFEVLEHLEDPLAFISAALAQTKTETFIFTTELFKGSPPLPGTWWYFSPETGQHISFYQDRTLREIARRLKLQYCSIAGLHLITARKISPVMRFLANGVISRLVFAFLKYSLHSRTMNDHKKMLKTGC